MLRVGLTGGIGAGKSTVATRLAEHGAVLVDSDVIAREVVAAGTDGLAEVVAAFGERVLAADGSLDRTALARLVFADDTARTRLNGIVHPRVRARAAELVAAAASDAILVNDVPLLVETGLAPTFHLVIVVDAPAEIRVRRLVDRGLAEDDAIARIAAQATDEQRRAVADVWLDNSGWPEEVQAAADALWAERLVPFEANVRLRRAEHWRPAPAEPDPAWPQQARRLIDRVQLAAGPAALRVDHVGPTAVPGLPAPDVIDLQLTVASTADADELADELAGAGFPRIDGPVAAAGDLEPSERLHRCADPGRAADLHIRVAGTTPWRHALLLRDWLRADAHARATSPDSDDDGWLAPAEAWATRTAWTPPPADVPLHG